MNISIKQHKKTISIPVRYITPQEMCEEQLMRINARISGINKSLRGL